MIAVMAEGAFEAAPHGKLFPGIGAVEVARLRAAAAALDAARPSADAPKWHWLLKHSVFPGPDTVGIPVIVCTTVSMHASPDDWTELELDVCWGRQGLLQVTAQVGVACFCDVDHNTHYVEELALEIEGERSLAAAFEEAVEHVIDWTSAPSDPCLWRAKAGLSSPPDNRTLGWV
ncbi:hypothetical protein [Streptomyces sp. NPDC002265]|uniref:hypothetical protein n=1 Tax=Streptomyces sp. NPDC002265 TaxID=3154415 RepID=UPI00331BBA2D